MEREKVVMELEQCLGDSIVAVVPADTVRDVLALLKAGATWRYYLNDEGKARWRCSNCGKLCRRNPHDKKYCSNCGSRVEMEG